MPQITKQDYDWLRSHKEHITTRNRYLRYVATIMLWLGISVANYYLLASFNAITLPIGILLFQFEIILWFGSYYVLCRLSHKKPESTLALTVALTFALTFALALALTVVLADSEEE
jgi:hypothetical protein